MPATLRRGSRGNEVQRLQELLNKRLQPSPNLSTDGDFGPRTEAAVRLYQATVGLGIDGIAGPRTWAALEAGQVTNPAAAAPAAASYPNAPWMALAMQERDSGKSPAPSTTPEFLPTTGRRPSGHRMTKPRGALHLSIGACNRQGFPEPTPQEQPVG